MSRRMLERTVFDYLKSILHLQEQMADALVWLCDVVEELREPEDEDDAQPLVKQGEPPHRREGASGGKEKPKPPRPTLH